MGRQRQLNEDAVNGVVLSVFFEQGQQSGLGNIRRLVVLDFFEAETVRRFDLQRKFLFCSKGLRLQHAHLQRVVLDFLRFFLVGTILPV
jgi:hypothetical protein